MGEDITEEVEGVKHKTLYLVGAIAAVSVLIGAGIHYWNSISQDPRSPIPTPTATQVVSKATPTEIAVEIPERPKRTPTRAFPTTESTAAPTDVPEPTSEPTAQPTATTTLPDRRDPAATYIVVSGDWLSKIARRFYGNARLWPEILRATNKSIETGKNFDECWRHIDNPDLIFPGDCVLIPPVLE